MCVHSSCLTEDTCSRCRHKNQSGPGFQGLSEEADVYQASYLDENGPEPDDLGGDFNTIGRSARSMLASRPLPSE